VPWGFGHYLSNPLLGAISWTDAALVAIEPRTRPWMMNSVSAALCRQRPVYLKKRAFVAAPFKSPLGNRRYPNAGVGAVARQSSLPEEECVVSN
jgi:hypothetical protein